MIPRPADLTCEVVLAHCIARNDAFSKDDIHVALKLKHCAALPVNVTPSLAIAKILNPDMQNAGDNGHIPQQSVEALNSHFILFSTGPQIPLDLKTTS
jgi:hypothetical protein